MKLLPKRGRVAVMELFGVIGGAVRPSQYVPPLLERGAGRGLAGRAASAGSTALVLDVVDIAGRYYRQRHRVGGARGVTA